MTEDQIKDMDRFAEEVAHLLTPAERALLTEVGGHISDNAFPWLFAEVIKLRTRVAELEAAEAQRMLRRREQAEALLKTPASEAEFRAACAELPVRDRGARYTDGPRPGDALVQFGPDIARRIMAEGR